MYPCSLEKRLTSVNFLIDRYYFIELYRKILKFHTNFWYWHLYRRIFLRLANFELKSSYNRTLLLCVIFITFNIFKPFIAQIIFYKGLLRRVPQMSSRGRRRSARAPQESAAQPCHAADVAGVGHGTVVGGAAGWSRASCLYGSLCEVLCGTYAVFQPETTAC